MRKMKTESLKDKPFERTSWSPRNFTSSPPASLCFVSWIPTQKKENVQDSHACTSSSFTSWQPCPTCTRAFAEACLQRPLPPSEGRTRGRTWGICTRRAGKLDKARSRLYRRRFLQVNTRWKALAEIYIMHSFAPISNLKIFV